MTTETIEGTVEAAAQNGDNYGIKIGDEWYNLSKHADKELQQRQRGLEQGDLVRLNVEEGTTFYEDLQVTGYGPISSPDLDSSSSDDSMRRMNSARTAAIALKGTGAGRGEFWDLVKEVEEYVGTGDVPE